MVVCQLFFFFFFTSLTVGLHVSEEEAPEFSSSPPTLVHSAVGVHSYMTTSRQMFKMSVEDLSLFASTRPGAAAVVGGSADGMPTASEQQQTHVQAAAAAVSHHAASVVRPQLVLLGDLSRAVGHGEAALLCASLLRDEEGAVGILR